MVYKNNQVLWYIKITLSTKVGSIVLRFCHKYADRPSGLMSDGNLDMPSVTDVYFSKTKLKIPRIYWICKRNNTAV